MLYLRKHLCLAKPFPGYVNAHGTVAVRSREHVGVTDAGPLTAETDDRIPYFGSYGRPPFLAKLVRVGTPPKNTVRGLVGEPIRGAARSQGDPARSNLAQATRTSGARFGPEGCRRTNLTCGTTLGGRSLPRFRGAKIRECAVEGYHLSVPWCS
jgi:hypothetical protein